MTVNLVVLAEERQRRARGAVRWLVEINPDTALPEMPWRIAVGEATDMVAAAVGGLDVHQRIAVTRALEWLADAQRPNAEDDW
jgi:hypothetical protein